MLKSSPLLIHVIRGVKFSRTQFGLTQLRNNRAMVSCIPGGCRTFTFKLLDLAFNDPGGPGAGRQGKWANRERFYPPISRLCHSSMFLVTATLVPEVKFQRAVINLLQLGKVPRAERVCKPEKPTTQTAQECTVWISTQHRPGLTFLFPQERGGDSLRHSPPQHR